MKNNSYDIDEQILRYYRNEMSHDEETRLLSWVKESAANRLYFQEQMTLAETMIQKKVAFDKNKGFLEFLEKTNNQTQKTRFRLFFKIAASLLLLLGMATFYILRTSKGGTIQLYTSNTPVTQVILKDSSRITLRQDAVLKAPEKFSKENRTVEFTGQAYFEISPDKNRAFKILINDITVEVLGTAFEIKTDSIHRDVEIRVETGVVKVYDKGAKHTFVVEKGQQLIVNQQTGLGQRTDLKNNNFLAWKTKKLVYQGVKMEKVVTDLMALYDKPIVFSDSTLKNCEVTFSVDNQSLDEVLLILEKLLGVEVFHLDNKIVLAGKGCENE